MLYTSAFVTMFVANLATVASFTLFFLFPLFIADHGGDPQDIGIIMGTFALASAFCRPWISDMIDRLGRKKSYTIGCLLLTLMPLFYLFFNGPLNHFYPALLAVRVLHGIGTAICFTTVFTYMGDIIPRERLNEGLGMFGVSGLIGLAIGPSLGEYVLKHAGFSSFFLTSAALALLGLLAQLPLKDTTGIPTEGGALNFFALLTQRKHRLVAILAALFGVGQAAVGNFVAPLAEARTLPHIFLFYTAYAIAAVGVRFAGGRLADRLGERRLLPWALLITGSGLMVLAWISSDPGLAFAGALCGGGHGLLFPSLNSLAIRNEPFHLRGKITGIFTGGIDFGIFFGSVLLGRIGDVAGMSALFAVASAALLIGLPIYRYQRTHIL